MSDTQETRMIYRCPICLMNTKDPVLKFDARKNEFFCQTCCFTGTPETIESYYDVMRSKYRSIRKRITLKTI